MKTIKLLIRKLIVYLLDVTDEWVVPSKIYNLIDGTDEDRKTAKVFLQKIEVDYHYDPMLRSALTLISFLDKVKD